MTKEIERGLAAAGLEESGDSLIAVAVAHQIPTESLLFWLKANIPGKEASLAAWRQWCATYCVQRSAAVPNGGSVPQAASSAPECPHCWSQSIPREDGSAFWCPTCGATIHLGRA